MPTTIRIPDELRDLIDEARGDVPRERWVRRKLMILARDIEVAAEAKRDAGTSANSGQMSVVRFEHTLNEEQERSLLLRIEGHVVPVEVPIPDPENLKLDLIDGCRWLDGEDS